MSELDYQEAGYREGYAAGLAAADERVRELVGALAEAVVPLEKIRMSMKWELTEVSKEEVINAVCVIRAALKK